MGGIAPVDVSGRDLRDHDVVVGDRQIGAVVGPPQHAVEVPGRGAVELDDLAPAGVGVLRVARGLTVHADVAGRLLDHTVGLARHDEGVLGQPHVERLAAAPQGELEAIGSGGGAGADRDRALEGGDGAAERLGRVVALGEPPAHETRDHLGVGGDRGGDAHRLVGDEVGEVVDVAVERADHVRSVEVEQVAVERMGVGLGDDADRRPPRVAEHERAGVVAPQRGPQQLVGGEGGPQHGGVVTQLADLGRRLVDDAQRPVDQTGTARSERLIGRATGDLRLHGGIVDVEGVAAHEHVDTGGVTAPDLEAVEGGQCLVDGEIGLQGTLRREPVAQLGDGLGGPDAVPGDGPEAVPDPDQFVVASLQLDGRQGGVALHRRLEVLHHLEDLATVVAEPRGDGGVGGQQAHAGHTPEQGVGGEEVIGRVAKRGGRVGAEAEFSGEPGQRVEDLRGLGCGSCRRAPGDGDDPAHASSRRSGCQV